MLRHRIPAQQRQERLEVVLGIHEHPEPLAEEWDMEVDPPLARLAVSGSSNSTAIWQASKHTPRCRRMNASLVARSRPLRSARRFTAPRLNRWFSKKVTVSAIVSTWQHGSGSIASDTVLPVR